MSRGRALAQTGFALLMFLLFVLLPSIAYMLGGPQ
ncbi:hypothetical protein FHT32_001244 [Variovorax sp. SG517]|nr:hypothetical protein [Variovorax sp. SG517]